MTKSVTRSLSRFPCPYESAHHLQSLPISTHIELPFTHFCISLHPIYTTRLFRPVSLLLQGYKVFARHAKFGTFQVPKEFLNTNKGVNTNKRDPAAVAPKTMVRHARRARVCPPCDKHRVALTTRFRKVQSCLINYTPLHGAEFLHIDSPVLLYMCR